jgi:hypothetical protein
MNNAPDMTASSGGYTFAPDTNELPSDLTLAWTSPCLGTTSPIDAAGRIVFNQRLSHDAQRH